MMKRLLAPLAVIAIIFASSCEKTYTCECSLSNSEETEVFPISAWNTARSEVKCIERNNAGPGKDGYYNCSIKELVAE